VAAVQQEHTENVNAGAEPIADLKTGKDEARREFSTISFPYGDLNHAVEFAMAVREVGGQSCLIEQLAGHLQVSPAGGAFLSRLSYTRIFGLVSTERGTIRLTPIGLHIVDASQSAAAKVDAFLAVPLYQKIYEKYRGYTLPPPSALEREMGALGVSPKQTGKARQAFERSAKQAGFFWAGEDRLTLPVLKEAPESRPIDDTTPPPQAPAEDRRGGGGTGGTYHPFIEGLLKTLPETGKKWPLRERAKWLTLAGNAFDLIYESDGNGTITIKVIAATDESLVAA
jgi:hypothetical protein